MVSHVDRRAEVVFYAGRIVVPHLRRRPAIHEIFRCRIVGYLDRRKNARRHLSRVLRVDATELR